MNYISTTNYTAILFNIQSIEEADTLLHAENHESQNCRALFAKCVAETAEKGVVKIYVESSPEGKLKYSESLYKKALQIDALTHEANISLDGWDYQETPEAVEATDKAFNSKMTLQAFQQEKKFLEEERDSIDVLIASKMGAIPSGESSKEEREKYRSSIMNLDDDDREFILVNLLKLRQSVIQITNLHEQINQAEEHYFACMNDLQEVVTRDFPLRTSAMRTTLKKLRKLRKNNEFKGKAIFQAGKNHLLTSEENQSKPEYDLAPLYSELKKHRAAILIPKRVSTD